MLVSHAEKPQHAAQERLRAPKQSFLTAHGTVITSETIQYYSDFKPLK